MKKATSIKTAIHLEQVPNIGPRIASDLRLLGIKEPADLKTQDPYKLYVQLCEKTKTYKDPCVLDVFMSAVYFAEGKKAKPWWDFTEERKKNFHKVDNQTSKWR